MRKIFIIFLSLCVLFSFGSNVEAAKKATPTPKNAIQKTNKKTTSVKKPKPSKKPTLKKTTTQSTKKSPTTSKSSGSEKIKGADVTVSYKVLGGSLVVTFGNTKNATSISYTLIYITNGQQEGAMGIIYPKGANTVSRTLLFGTCSKNVCRYHTNISNMVLEVKAKLKSGKTFSSSYTIGT